MMKGFKRKLFSSLGPLVLAGLIVLGLLFSPLKMGTLGPKTLKKAASSMSINVIKGDDIKNTAMQSSAYVPFFGSSELSRIDSFHPSVLAEKYHRSYTPFLLGAAGTQSLSQFSMLQSMGQEMRGRKAVFILSPQWFVKDGLADEVFDVYYSPLQVNGWILNLKEITVSDEYYAKRLLRFRSVRSDTNLKTVLKAISKGEFPTELQLKSCETKRTMLEREDELFGFLGLLSKEDKIRKSAANLPSVYDYEDLTRLADKQGKKATSNNPYGLTNGFYTTRIQGQEASLKDSQAKFNYCQSPEFADFQLVLEKMAELEMDVQFIIPPVNQKWSDYTGLSQEMLQNFAKKAKYQLEQQGFHRVLDLNEYADTPYFMADTIHLGWQGWLTIDQTLAPFLEAKEKTTVQYQMNHAFFDKEWCQLDPEEIKN